MPSFTGMITRIWRLHLLPWFPNLTDFNAIKQLWEQQVWLGAIREPDIQEEIIFRCLVKSMTYWVTALLQAHMDDQHFIRQVVDVFGSSVTFFKHTHTQPSCPDFWLHEYINICFYQQNVVHVTVNCKSPNFLNWSKLNILPNFE